MQLLEDIKKSALTILKIRSKRKLIGRYCADLARIIQDIIFSFNNVYH